MDESCDNFTCDSGFKKNDDVGQFNCTEDGTWDYDLTTLCTGSTRHVECQNFYMLFSLNSGYMNATAIKVS